MPPPQWADLLRCLQDLVDWITRKEDELHKQQPMGGDVNSIGIQKQQHEVNYVSDNDIIVMQLLHKI